MENNHMTMREKLNLMKEIKERNEWREKEFARMKAEQEEKYMVVTDLYVHGEISKEAFHRYIRKIRANETTQQVTEQHNE